MPSSTPASPGLETSQRRRRLNGMSEGAAVRVTEASSSPRSSEGSRSPTHEPQRAAEASVDLPGPLEASPEASFSATQS